MANVFLDAALEYAARGWHVVPLKPRGKKPIFHAWQIVAERHGADPEKLKLWWDTEPNANVGILTGLASGVIVVDVDPRNGGDDALLDHFPNLKAWGKGLRVRTGSGGLHFYIKHPWLAERRPIQSRTGKRGVGNGLELKADGGHQVVAPPSIHPETGKAYEWAEA
jgi:hypothetical protein